MKLHLRIFYTFSLILLLLMSAVMYSLYDFQKKELITTIEQKVNITGQSIAQILENLRQTSITRVSTIAKDWALRSAIGRNERETIISALNNHRERAGAKEVIFFGLNDQSFSSGLGIDAELSAIKKLVFNKGNDEKYQIVFIKDRYYQIVISEVKAPQNIGWLCIIYAVDNINDAVLEVTMAEGIEAIILDNNVRQSINFVSAMQQAKDYSPFFIASAASSGYSHVMRDRELFISRLSPLLKGSDISVVVIGNAQSGMIKLEKFLKKMTLMFLGFALLALLISYFATKAIIRSLSIFIATAKKLGQGDFTAQVDINRTDEIGDLAVAFKQLQTAISIREHKVTEAMDKLQYQARHDPLTGLANRRVLSEKLKSENEEIKTHKMSFSLCILDLDRFKLINDSAGHPAGDLLLQQLSMLFCESVYPTDNVIRLGGDEFAIILYNCAGDDAFETSDNIRQKVEDFIFTWEGMSYKLGVSIGVLSIFQSVDDISDILKQADASCFIAKEAGRNRVHLVEYGSSETDEKLDEIKWAHVINDAVENDKLILFIQPMVPLNGTKYEPECVEVIVKMRDYSTGELVSPAKFLGPAERYGLSSKIDTWVINQLLKVTAIFREMFNDNRVYWINLSGASLSDENFISYLDGIVSRGLLPANSLNFEISEMAIIRNMEQTAVIMKKLKQRGCQFALDDFGAGLTSFNYLKSLPSDVLKIDGMFIRNILEDNVDRMFVKSIIAIAHTMDMKVVAESIESKEILQVVTALGVDYGQGSALGKPVDLLPQVV